MQIEEYYEHCASIRQTAEAFGISPQKCRRMLISAGVYTTPLASKIAELYEQGVAAEQIAKILGMRAKTVLAYTPYTKGVYNDDNPSKNALAIRRHREKHEKD